METIPAKPQDQELWILKTTALDLKGFEPPSPCL
jgi:hypothetical protein